MDKQEINQYLTEKVFRECWHTISPYRWGYSCDCTEAHGFDHSESGHDNNDFFTNEGCMKLWLKIQECDWFDSFWYDDPDMFAEHEDVWFIHPDRLAPAVYEFLKGD